MRNLLRLLIKYYAVFLFILLEGISVFLLVQHNHYQHATFINASSGVIGFANKQWTSITDYFSLRKENLKLQEENLRLHRQLEEKSAFSPDYETGVIAADVINSSVFRQKNHLTLDKGEKQGIKKQMAVISPQGVVGVIESVSTHFATVIPIINTNFNLSAKIKRNDYYGSVSWDGQSHRIAQLDDIPAYVRVEIGDTIITSGFSPSFPEGKFIGIVDRTEKSPSAAFWEIDIKLATDFKQIQSVYVLDAPLQEEQTKLESTHD
jgi:rod shape-determining protein MreC